MKPPQICIQTAIIPIKINLILKRKIQANKIYTQVESIIRPRTISLLLNMIIYNISIRSIRVEQSLMAWEEKGSI